MTRPYLTLQMDVVMRWVDQVSGPDKIDWRDVKQVWVAVVPSMGIVEVEYLDPGTPKKYRCMPVHWDEWQWLAERVHRALMDQTLDKAYCDRAVWLTWGHPRNMVLTSSPTSWYMSTFDDKLLPKFYEQYERLEQLDEVRHRIDWQAILKVNATEPGVTMIQTPALQLGTIRNWLMNANILPTPRLTNSTDVAEIVLAYKGLELVYEIKHTNVEKNHGPCHAVVGTIEMARLTGFLVDALVKTGVSREHAKYNVYRTDGLPMPMYVKVSPHSWDAHVIGSTSVDEFEQLFDRAKINNQTVMTLFPRVVIDNWLIPNKHPRPVPQWGVPPHVLALGDHQYSANYATLTNPITKEPALHTIFGVDMLKAFQPYLNIPLGDYKEENLNGVTVTIDTLAKRMTLQVRNASVTGTTDEYEFQFSEEQIWEAHRRFEAMFVKYHDRFRNIPRNDGVHSFRGGRGCPRYDFKLI